MLHRRKQWRAAALGLAAVTALLGAAATPASATTSTAMSADSPTATQTSAQAGSPQIVGGTPAPSYSAVASLQLTYHGDPNFHWCGATLVDPWHLEGNAHCVTNQPAPGTAQRAAANLRFSSWLNTHPATDSTHGTDDKHGTDSTAGSNSIDFSDPAIWHVRIGSNDRLHGGVVRHISTITVFPTWNWGVPDAQGRIGDIAILRLDRPVTTLAPAMIAQSDPANPVRAVGWGMTTQPTDWTGPPPEMLSQIDLPLVSTSDCADSFIGAWELCIGVPPRGGGPCNGDSGSPALQQSLTGQWAQVVGSTSRGTDDGVSCGQTPVVFTSTYAYRFWIALTVRGQRSGPTA